MKRAWIEGHIPHQGRMCLLDEVIDWGKTHISCRAVSHRDPDNPLRSQERLGTACGIEYAAQAMALHDVLVGGSRREVGFLASVRGVRQFVRRLDDIQSDLTCGAVLVAGDGLTALYEFSLRAQEQTLLTGRVTVVLDANQRMKT